MQAPFIVFLMGPTACGKTLIALELAKQLNAEIISVDSALVYRGMDIGTAKPDPVLTAQVPHHLIDICDPSQPYSVADFCNDAQAAITDILSRGRLPLLVGGTMMYFNALKQPLSSLPSSDPIVRADIMSQAATLSWPVLHQQLADLDPRAAQVIHPHDAQRIARALEVYALTGVPMGQQMQQEKKCAYRICSIAIMPHQRHILHDQIKARFDLMLAQGFMAEVEALYHRDDLSADLPAMRSVGYRQAWQYLAGDLDFNIMREKTIAATRQLAKRQVTWLRAWADLSWFVPFSSSSIIQYVQKVQQE
ncbi:MAG TPA: tRNA (adenosine(37)-N6)-dimethylallyltransferase MiaA [Gammaproteobacteria bacterium]|nr:tRNA (adenosine(37)-N6)-dimethylallyltransferase MiaA [Gammaproteobacteria bacterium]